MNTIYEFFASVPMVAFVITVFVLALVWVLARCFRMPPAFMLKEEFRDEVRYKLVHEAISKVAKEKADAEKAQAEAEEAAAEKEKMEKAAKEKQAAEANGGKG